MYKNILGFKRVLLGPLSAQRLDTHLTEPDTGNFQVLGGSSANQSVINSEPRSWLGLA